MAKLLKVTLKRAYLISRAAQIRTHQTFWNFLAKLVQKFADEANGNNVDAKYDVDGHANSNDDNSNDTKANNDENASKNDHDGNDAIDDNANDDDDAASNI